ncbi:hypothetical protein Back11_02890 [Paenibacillus baekrokdamisoli]|uniref:Uncharacterized protein n=1 Tax=Paenibacillus baekrokdamisoli TaxID=1712516 RepID=A0A3G9J6F2_9BACL|nr:hypothetical protein Back11_02890 [Paenibacillus baekrokdamisoli]
MRGQVRKSCCKSYDIRTRRLIRRMAYFPGNMSYDFFILKRLTDLVILKLQGLLYGSWFIIENLLFE